MPDDQVRTKRIAFDENTVATHEVVAAIGGDERIKVKAMHLHCLGTCEVSIQTGSTVLAAYPLIAQDQISLDMIEGSDRWFETAVGEALNIDLAQAERVTGFIVYEQS